MYLMDLREVRSENMSEVLTSSSRASRLIECLREIPEARTGAQAPRSMTTEEA